MSAGSRPSTQPSRWTHDRGGLRARVRFGPMVTPLARRRPWKLARELTTLEHLSGGRLTIGVGLGGPPGLEYGDFGEDTNPQTASSQTGRGARILRGLGRGSRSATPGATTASRGGQMLPTPLQSHVPIWVGGEWPEHRAPFRRAARYDGVHPLLFSVPPDRQPAAIAELVSFIRDQRDDDRPFEVVFGAETVGNGSSADQDLVAKFAAAGVTWWMEPISHWRGSLSDMRERIHLGPPHTSSAHRVEGTTIGRRQVGRSYWL